MILYDCRIEVYVIALLLLNVKSKAVSSEREYRIRRIPFPILSKRRGGSMLGCRMNLNFLKLEGIFRKVVWYSAMTGNEISLKYMTVHLRLETSDDMPLI